MKVHQKHSKVTQNMHGASRNDRYVWDVSGNYRNELIDFEILDWESQCHAILGRPTFVQFMVVPHYA